MLDASSKSEEAPIDSNGNAGGESLKFNTQLMSGRGVVGNRIAMHHDPHPPAPLSYTLLGVCRCRSWAAGGDRHHRRRLCFGVVMWVLFHLLAAG
jgi:hypothetical protein